MNIRQALAYTFLGHSLNHSLTLLYPVVMISLRGLYPEASLTTFGIIGTLHYALYGAGAFPAGWLTDRLGAKNILIIYLLGSAASIILLLAADSLIQISFGLALLGLFCSLYHPAGLTLLSHASPTISRHLGIHGIAGSIGLTLGPLVGGVMAAAFGWKAPYLLFGIIALVSGISLLRVPTTPHSVTRASHRQSQRKSDYRALLYLFIGGTFMGLSHRGVLSFMPIHFASQIPSTVDPALVGGFFTALVMAVGIVGQYYGGVLGEHLPRHKILVWTIGLNIPFLLLIPYFGVYIMMISALAWGLVNFAVQPLSNSLVSDYSHPSRRGTLFGIFHGLSFGVGAFAATVAGVIAERYGTAMIFPAMAIFLLPAIGSAWLLRNHLPEYSRNSA